MVQMDSAIGVFAIILGALSRTTCMSADGQANLAALHDKQEQFTSPALLQGNLALPVRLSLWLSLHNLSL